MATSGGNSGAIHASANANAGGGSNAGNPRKFAEKIQILNIKGAEETSEFEKIMQECAAVRAGRGPTNTSSQIIEGPKQNPSINLKSPNFSAQIHGQIRATSPANSGFPNIYAGASGGIVTPTGTQHLRAAPLNVQYRHGSMPNMVQLSGNGTGNMTNNLPVGDLPAMLKHYNVTNPVSINSPSPAIVSTSADVNMQQGNLETIARISEIISMSPVPSMSTSSCTTSVDGNHISRKHLGNQTPQQYHTNRTRLNTTPSASTHPNSNSSGSGLTGASNSPGPIRHREGMKSRRHETSPFERKPAAPEAVDGNRRESGGSTGSNYSTQHLSPPDLSVRRFYSDPSLHQTVNGVQQLSSQDHTAPVSDICGSQTIVPTQINEHLNPNIGFGTSLGGLSPLQNASPTISRRVLDGSQGNIPLESVTNAYVQMINHGNSNGPVSSDSQTQMMRNAHVTGISYLPLPGGISGGGSGDNLTVASNTGAFIPGGGGKPSGSLPDLTNFHVNSHSPSPCPGQAAPGESSNGPTMPFSQSLSTTAGCSPNYSPGMPRNASMNNNGNAKLTLGRFLNNKDAQKQTIQFSSNSTSSENANKLTQNSYTIHPPTSAEEATSPTLTYQHPNTAKSVVRLSDNEISEILSLPIALVSDDPYSTESALLSGSTTPSNVATSTATTDTSVISHNNENNQMPNIVGFDNKVNAPVSNSGHIERNRGSTAVNNIFINKNNNNNNNNSKTETICDNSLDFLNPIQNVINMNKGVEMDQSDNGILNDDGQSELFGANGQVNFEGASSHYQQHFPNKMDDVISNYRNPQSIPAAHSPCSTLQGGGTSPFGARSTSPIDISSLTGSPHHSPSIHCNPLPSIGSLESAGSIPGGGTNGYSVGTFGSGGSPGYSSDMMISAGGVGGSVGSNTQMDLGLSKEFQRFTVPLHDWMNGGSQNQLGVDGATGAIDIGNHQQHASMPSPNPQTPSSIPDILISRCGDDASSDQTLQRLIALGEFDNDSMFSDELRADLGKLDDNMIRLLEDNVQMDQNIADAVTEEHLKL